jgi:hypothetical protein
LRQFLGSLKALEAKKFEPMWVRLAGQQLCGAFAHPFRHPRPDEAAVVQEKLKRAQVEITQAAAQEKVIA